MVDKLNRHWLILALCLAPYFLNLSASALWDANEAFYVEGPREMLASGEFITPRFNFADKLNKPILSYWVVIAAFKLFGVSEWAERVAAATCLCLSVILTYLIGVKLYDRRAALLAAVALATSFKFVAVGRRSMIDALLTLTVVAAIYFFVLGWQRAERRRIYILLFYAMMALGVLTKGLLGVIIPGGIAGLFVLFVAQAGSLRDRLKQVVSLPGVLVFLAIAAPWFAVMADRHGSDYLVSFFVGEHFSRYVHGTFGFQRPFWYYLPTVFGEFAPWSFFLPAAIVAAWRRRSWDEVESKDSDSFVFIWLVFILLFFSFSSAKLSEYMLQLYPAAALLVGRLLSDSEVFKSKSVVGLIIVFTGLLILALAFGGWLFVLAAGKLFGAKLVAYAPAVMMAAAAVALGWAMWGCFKKVHHGDTESTELTPCSLYLRGEKVFLVTALATLLINISFLALLPEIERYRPVKPLAERINREATESDLVGYYKFTAPSLCYYTRRKIFEVFFADEVKQLLRSDKRVFTVMAEREYRELSGDESLSLRLLECRASLFPLTMKRFLALRGAEGLEKVCLVTNK